MAVPGVPVGPEAHLLLLIHHGQHGATAAPCLLSPLLVLCNGCGQVDAVDAGGQLIGGG